MTTTTTNTIRIDFSLKREVFFVVIGAIIGALTMIIPKTIFEVEMGLPYYLSWIAFGHVLGVYSSASVIVGIGIHLVTAISIGVVVGIFLYKTGILNISKVSNGLLYGIISGLSIILIFFIPVQQFVLNPQIISTMIEMDKSMSLAQAAHQISHNFLTIMIGSIIMHLVFGITLGLVSSGLSIKFGSRYRCNIHDISFPRIDSYQKHMLLIHGIKPIEQKKILILGGGFAGIQVLRKVQDAFQNDVSVDISLVSKDNFFLFTPMLPEISSGMIESRHIATPVRSFCKRARFYEALADSVDLQDRQVVITHLLGDQMHSKYHQAESHSHTLNYDYLVLALGSETNFFGMSDVEENSFTLKSLGDAIILRNHVISMLEQADLEHDNEELRKGLMTIVVVGGGFSGVEIVGELNDFVRESVTEFYHNIDQNHDVRIILVNSQDRILPEVSEELGAFALQKLRKSGVEIMLNARVSGATAKSVKLHDDKVIPCHTLIWTGGVTPSRLLSAVPCEHDKAGRIIVNNYLQAHRYPGVYALGDCAFVTDPHTGKPYPPTAQHAIREGTVVAHNIIAAIKGGFEIGEAEEDHSNMTTFDYKTKGVMAELGKRTGVGDLLGIKVHGFIAWWIWRSYYLSNLPTIQKKLRVMADWSIDLFFKRDITRIRTYTEEKGLKTGLSEAEVIQ
jgi:NADH dehydrogenase FAD-containing subunit